MLTKNLTTGALAFLATMMLCETGFSQGVDPDALFKQLDKNSDGVVTLDEIPDAKKQIFSRLLRIGDKNKDSKLTRDEIAGALASRDGQRPRAEGNSALEAKVVLQGRGGKQQGAGGKSGQRGGGFGQGGAGRGGGGMSVSPDAIFKRFDTNKDGKLSKDEIPQQAQRMQQMIGAADKNRDGAITKKELTEFLKNARGQGGGQPSRGGRAGGGSRSPGVGGSGSKQSGAGGKPGQRGGGFGQGGRGGAGRGGMSVSPDAIFKRFDTNKDGKLTKDEIPQQAQRMQQMIGAADKNRDGAITKKELTDFLKNAGGKGGRQRPGRGQQSRGGRPDFFKARLPKAGEPLPNLTAYSDDGKPFKLSNLKGKYSVLVFGCLT